MYSHHFLLICEILACHKLSPAGGAGAGNALQDAVVLANYIHALPLHPVVEEIEAAFEAYKTDRIEWCEKAYATSKMLQSVVDKVKMKKNEKKRMVDVHWARIETLLMC